MTFLLYAIQISRAFVVVALGLLDYEIGNAARIDFEALRHDDALEGFYASDVVTNGFTVSSLFGGFGSLGTLDSRFAGSTALFERTVVNPIVLTRQDFSRFDLKSIDLAYLNNPPDGPLSIRFCGEQNELGICSVTQAFSLAETPGLQTFSFATDFSNLKAVVWYQGLNAEGGFGPTHQFDNIVVMAVPEPSMFLVFGLGLALLFYRRARS